MFSVAVGGTGVSVGGCGVSVGAGGVLVGGLTGGVLVSVGTEPVVELGVGERYSPVGRGGNFSRYSWSAGGR